MTIEEMLREIKERPGFTENVGMMLAHNGVVRGWTRAGHKAVDAVTVRLDRQKLAAICREVEARPGIFAVAAEGREGRLLPGEDLLLLVVAGDVRENVTPAMTELLARAKAEAVTKVEHLAESLPAD